MSDTKVLRTAIHKASRFYRCEECGATIKPENVYQLVVSLRPFKAHKECPHCALERERRKANSWLVSARLEA